MGPFGPPVILALPRLHACVNFSFLYVMCYQQSVRFVVVYSFCRVAIQKSEDINVRRLSADERALLVCNKCEGDESSSGRLARK